MVFEKLISNILLYRKNIKKSRSSPTRSQQRSAIERGEPMRYLHFFNFLNSSRAVKKTVW